MKKIILVLISIFLLASPSFSKAQELIPKTIIYGGDEAFPPYEFLNKNGKPEGFNIDLIRAIGKTMGIKVKIRLGPWYKIAHELEHSDSIQIASMYFSKNRLQMVDYASPTEMSYYELYFRKGQIQFSDLKSLNGKTVAVEKSSVLDTYLTHSFPKIKLLRTSSEITALKALSEGRCYAAFASSIMNYKLIRANHFDNLVKYHVPFLPRIYSFVVKKGNKQLLNILNIGLLRLQDQDEFHKLREKWIHAKEEPWIVQNLKWVIGIIVLLIIWFIAWIIVLRYSVKSKTKALKFANSRLKLIAGFKPTRIDKLSAQEQVTGLLEHIKETFEADACIIRVLKDDQLKLFESVGVDSERLMESFPADEGLGEKVIAAKKPLTIKNALQEKYHIKLEKKYPRLYRFKSYAGAPLIFEGNVIGIIGVYYSHSEKAFAAEELEEFQIVADQLAVSFENARLFEQNEKQKEILVKQIVSRKAAEAELQKSLQTANMLYKTSRELSLSMDIKVVGNSILKSLEKLLKWRMSSIWIMDNNTNKLSLLAHANMDLKGTRLKNELDNLKKIIRKEGDGIIDWVASNGKAVRSGDIKTDSRYLEIDPKVKSKLCVPIIIDETSIGCINIESTEKDAFSEDNEKLVTTLANLASSAIQNATLFEKLNIELKERTRAEKEVEKLNKDLELRVEQRTEELRAINKELQSFVYSISHDLRAPLRSITGFSEIISRRHKDSLNEEGQEYFGYIVEASHYMGNLINDLLQFSRLARNPLSKKPVNLEEVLDTVQQNLSQDIKEKKANIIISGKMPVINGDRSLVSQIFSNLMQNSIKYHRPGVNPEIVLSGKEDNNSVIIEVQDNGQGIPEEHFEKIFDIFQRLHTDEYPGTGIGLAIVKKAVTALGGSIYLESEVNSGTTFYVKFSKT